MPPGPPVSGPFSNTSGCPFLTKPVRITGRNWEYCRMQIGRGLGNQVSLSGSKKSVNSLLQHSIKKPLNIIYCFLYFPQHGLLQGLFQQCTCTHTCNKGHGCLVSNPLQKWSQWSLRKYKMLRECLRALCLRAFLRLDFGGLDQRHPEVSCSLNCTLSLHLERCLCSLYTWYTVLLPYSSLVLTL